MRIENEIKLDFSDVLIRPKRSTLSSRKEVDLTRNYTFRHSKLNWSGVPIMAANMDGVGTFQMAKTLQEHKLFTCMVKSYDVSAWVENSVLLSKDNIAASTGISNQDFNKLKEVLTQCSTIKFICIDVANGYSEYFGDFIERVRTEFPDKTIIAGNVVTADMTQEDRKSTRLNSSH